MIRRFLAMTERPPLPPEIYTSTVNALYSDARSLLIGVASASLAAFVTGLAAGEPVFVLFSLVLAGIGCVRWMHMRAYAAERREGMAMAAVERWETRYTFWSGAFVTVLALWCLVTFTLARNPALELISFAVCLAYLVGVAGRNFSSDRLVTTQIICAAPPMIAALLVQGNPYHAFLAFLLLPFFLSLRMISTRLRNMLFEAVVSTHKVTAIAGRFDAALNNMPHGLGMFGADQRLEVGNDQFFGLLNIDGGRDWRGFDAAEIMDCSIRAGALTRRNSGHLPKRVVDRMQARGRSSLTLETQDEGALQLTFQPMENGGCVVLLEDITERRNAEAKIERLASYDALTGLANRTLFKRNFESVARGGLPGHLYAIHFVDLDQFKRVNDTLGHPVGDALLCAVAERLRRIVRQSDYISRFGGDEFVLLQSLAEGHEEQAGHLAARIIDHLSAPYHIGEHEIVIGASIGVALAPGGEVEFDELLKNADMALYTAKSEGRGVWRYFEKDMDVKAQARRTLETSIRRALANDEFKSFYQPIVDVKTGRIVSCEALVRWEHPERGIVSPAEFIPVAEEMGLIVQLGDVVLHAACAECREWPSDVSVAVNLSPIQFRRSDAPAAVRRALEATGLPPERLVVEITESVLLEDNASTHRALSTLREMGVRIALDDFGTGYSSLSYLHLFPLNKIKVDRSFLQRVEEDPRTLTLLRGISRLSKDLNMTVVIEGVEKQSQLEALLHDSAVDEVQGYLFGRPQPSEMIRKRLGKRVIPDIRRVA